MNPEAKATDWTAHSQTGSRVICREAIFCVPSCGNNPVNKTEEHKNEVFDSDVC